MAAPTTEEQPGIVPEAPRSPYNKWWKVSAVIVGLIVVMALYLAVTPPARQAHPAPPAVASAPAAPPSATPVSECGLPAGDQTATNIPPADTTWRLVGTMSAPYNPDTVGPARQFQGLGLCYAPTPVGALYAAVNFIATTTAATTPDLQKAAVERLAAPGPARDAALTALASQPPSGHNPTVQPAGFLYSSYVPASSAVVDLVFTTGTGGWAHFQVALVFTDGDWKIQPTPSGALSGPVAYLTTLGGYAQWGP